MHSIGMRVHAINRHGRTDEQVDWIGTPERPNESPVKNSEAIEPSP